MKNLIVTSIVVGTLALATGSLAQLPTTKIVTIDLNQVFNDYYKTPISSVKLREAASAFTKEHEDMLADFKKQVEELNKLREDAEKPEYTPEVREQKRKAVTEKLQATQKMERDVREFEASHRKMLDEQSQRMRQNILKEITEVVQKESRDAGYTLVIDKSGNTLNGVPPVVFSIDSIDISAEIIKILNKNAPRPVVTQPKPAEQPEPKKVEKKDEKK